MSNFPVLTPEDDTDDTGNHIWPTLVDIMMVILMIFMLGTMVLVISNDGLTNRISLLSSENDKTKNELSAASARQKWLKQRLLIMREQQKDLEDQLKNSWMTNEAILAQLADKQKSYDALNEQKNKSNEELKLSQDKLNRLIAELTSSQNKIQTLSQSLSRAEDATNSWQNKFGSLKVKYDKLLRPARSPKGKRVIEIVYRRVGSQRRLAIKTSDRDQSRFVTEKNLHVKLSRLKQQYPNKLYLRIVFPDGNKVSHQEAWEFTQGLLEKYDYYYQSSPKSGSKGRR